MTKLSIQTIQYYSVPALLLFMAGALLAASLHAPIWLWLVWVGFSLFCSLFCFFTYPKQPIMPWFFWLCSFLIGGAYFTAFHFEPGPQDIVQWADKPQASLTGTLTGLGPNAHQWVIQADKLDQHPATGKVLIKLSASTNDIAKSFSAGQTIHLTGRLIKPHEAQFPGDFDYRNYLHQHAITAVFYPQQIQILPQQEVSLWFGLINKTHQVRQRLTQHFQEVLPPAQGDILSSIVLGEHAVGIDPDIKQSFIRSGLIHIMAASGLNVGLIGFFFLFLGDRLGIPRRVSLLIAMAGVGFYCLLTGLPPSVQRAGLMLELALMLKLIRRELTALFLLCLTGGFLLLLNPMIVTMIGFQLSFLSALGLIIMVPPLQEKLGFYLTRWGAGFFLIPLIAQLWVTPILLYYFHQVQLLSLPANLVALPIAASLTYIGFVMGGISLVLPQLSAWFLSKIGFLCQWLVHIATFFGEHPLSVWVLPAPPASTIVLILGLLLLMAYWFHFPQKISRKQLLISGFSLLLLIFIPASVSKWQQQSQIRLAWLPHGYGKTSTIIQDADGTVIVNVMNLDIQTARDIRAYLYHQGISRLHLLNLASSHVKNVDGLPLLTQAVHILEMTSPRLASTKVQRRLIEHAQQTRTALTPISSTHLIHGKSIQGALYTASPSMVLQRFSWPHTNSSIVFYEGGIPLSESPLEPFAQNCQVLTDNTLKQTTIFTSSAQSKTFSLMQFQQIVFNAR